MAYNLAPFLKQRYFDTNGDPLSGGKLYSYQAGTTTPQATYTDSTGGTPNANPVILDANGEASVWLDISLSYKFVLKDSSGLTQWTEDNVIGLAATDTVGTVSIQNSAVTTAKIADDAVTADKLADHQTIDANRAVTTNHIRDSAVNIKKLDTSTTTSSKDVFNLTISATVATNAMTIALKTLAGSDPTAADHITMAFRSSSSTSGTFLRRTVSAAISIVIPASTTIGTISGAIENIYLYAIDNSGTVELAVSLNGIVDEGTVQNTTAIAGGTSRAALYSTTARTGVGVRLVGRITATQATAGTWASSASEVSIAPFLDKSEKIYANYANNSSTVLTANVTDIPFITKGSDPNGCWSGTTFTPGRAGFFIFVGNISCTTGATRGFSLYLNGTQKQFVGGTSGGNLCNFSAGLFLVATDVVSFRSNAAGTLNNVATDHWISILG